MARFSRCTGSNRLFVRTKGSDWLSSTDKHCHSPLLVPCTLLLKKAGQKEDLAETLQQYWHHQFCHTATPSRSGFWVSGFMCRLKQDSRKNRAPTLPLVVGGIEERSIFTALLYSLQPAELYLWLSALQTGRYWASLLVESCQPNQLQPDPAEGKTPHLLCSIKPSSTPPPTLQMHKLHRLNWVKRHLPI